MRRARLIVLIAGAAALVIMGLPAVALAGTFTWSLPANFTATGGGANPDHDAYGARPWSYDQSGVGGLGGPSHDPSAFAQLPIFSRSYAAPLTGLVGWGDDGVSPGALIATNPTGSAISSGNYTGAAPRPADARRGYLAARHRRSRSGDLDRDAADQGSVARRPIVAGWPIIGE